MATTCDYCDSSATRISYYGADEDTAPTVYHCGRCMSPCNHYADPHASWHHERRIKGQDGCKAGR